MFKVILLGTLRGGAVLKAHFPRLRSALKSSRLTWYAIDQEGHAVRATDQITAAAICEEKFRRVFVFVLGDPQDVEYEEIISGRTERIAFCMYQDGDRMFLLNFDEIPLDGVEIEDADWYGGK